jgi:hypothetical protein
MTSADNLEFLLEENRRYIIGTNKSLLKKFEQELLKQNWKTIREDWKSSCAKCHRKKLAKNFRKPGKPSRSPRRSLFFAVAKIAKRRTRE